MVGCSEAPTHPTLALRIYQLSDRLHIAEDFIAKDREQWNSKNWIIPKAKLWQKCT